MARVLCYSLIKLLLPAEKAALPTVVPRPVPGMGHQQGFRLSPMSLPSAGVLSQTRRDFYIPPQHTFGILSPGAFFWKQLLLAMDFPGYLVISMERERAL